MSPSRLCELMILAACCVKFSTSASLSLNEQKKYKNLIEGQGLYSVDDDVEIFTADNFKSRLYGQKQAILLEFYNSWCGFCQRFASSWKGLATDLLHWKKMIRIAAFDCSDDDNAPICREFDVMYYPSLRYFHEEYVEGPKLIGKAVTKGTDVYEQKKHLLMALIDEQRENRGRMYPDIVPYVASDLSSIFPHSVSRTFLVVDKPDTLFGPEVAVELKRVPQISIRYTFSNNTALLNNIWFGFDANSFPALFVVDSTLKIQLVGQLIKSRDNFVKLIKEYLEPLGISIPKQPSFSQEIFTGKWMEGQVPDMASLMEAREHEALKRKIKTMGDVVFQIDLETALRSSLKHEVATTREIAGEKLLALRNYLNVILKYFPLGPKAQTLLRQVKDHVNQAEVVQGADIARFLQNDDDAFSSPQNWLACQGTVAGHRGYPCGLWKMFHYLTVNADEDDEPRVVLEAMHGYVKNFFGCTDCSRHFQEMSARRNMNEVESHASAIMWLWMAHNEVNKRLSGDATEDPEFPKVPFPTKEHCPACRNSDNSWNYPEVLQYMKVVYHRLSVRYIGSDTRMLHYGAYTASSGSASVFPNVDTSMCFILYVVCFGLLAILIRMVLKRGYRRKLYVHDLLGKA